MRLQTQSLSTQAYHLILREILSGKRKAGTRISEESLCSELGISRTPAREALVRLASDGVVERAERRGCRVAHLDQTKQRDMIECRALLEAQALALSIDKIPDGILRENLAALRKAKANHDALASLEADDCLHQLILDACPNRTLVEVVSRLQRQCNAIRSLRATSVDVTSVTHERIQIIQAILKRDKAKACLLLKKHILQGLSLVGVAGKG